MRQYFSKAVLVNHPLIDEMCDELGNDSYRFLTILTDLWQEIGEFEITAKLLKQRCRINAQKSERIIERFSKYFHESLKILKLVEESSVKLNKVEKSSTLDGQNTDGSTRDLDKKREDKEENRLEKEYLPEEFEKAYKIATDLASNSPSSQSIKGLDEFLRVYFTTAKPKDLDLGQILECWTEACELWFKGLPYVKVTFKNKMSEYHTKQKKGYSNNVPSPAREAEDKLKQMLKYKQWRSYWNKDDIIQTAELQRLSDRSVFHQKHGPIDVSNLSSWVVIEEDVAV
jgi:hypothetical protein